MKHSRKQLILLELNEINFDVVQSYIGKFPERYSSLRRLLTLKWVKTSSEKEYDNLEPWIQWPSVHTLRPFKDHQIFRLGDIVKSKAPQIFEVLEKAGFKVGAISPMNAENRMDRPSYFIPDPWTETKPDASFWSRMIGESISQLVNDNAQSKITMKSALQIGLALAWFAHPSHYGLFVKLILQSRRKPWLKAAALDLLLHDVHRRYLHAKLPDFSTLFLNAGAHIQHHYFFNADPLRDEVSQKNPEWYVSKDEDPLSDVLDVYDIIVGEFLAEKDLELLVATGLSQEPYTRVKFYYRLNEHARFLDTIGIQFSSVHPLMTRDFVIEFDNADKAAKAQSILSSITVNDSQEPLFDQIDNRRDSLFVTLSYPDEITEATSYKHDGISNPLKPLVSFVAIKNGMHNATGYAFFSDGVAPHSPKNESHVMHIGQAIINYFDVKMPDVTP